MAFYRYSSFASGHESEFSSSSSDYYSSCSSDMSDPTRSTPHKIKSQNLTKTQVDSYKIVMQAESRGHTIRQIPFRRFVEEVLKLPNDSIKKIESRQWTLSETHVVLYEKADTVGKERDLHSPFVTLSRILLAEIIQELQSDTSSSELGSSPSKVQISVIGPNAASAPKVPPQQPILCDGPHWTTVGSQRFDLTSGLYDTGGGIYFNLNGKAKPKPDFVFYKAGRVPVHKSHGNTFNLVQRPGEFKKRRRSAKRLKLAGGAAASQGGSLSTIPESTAPPPSLAGVTSSDIPTAFQPSTTTEQAAAGSKRKASDSVEADQPEGEPESRLVSGVADETGLTVDQAQLAVYAMACLSTGTRVYTTGLFVESWKVTIFYFDHMAILQCESFDFRNNVTWFAVLLYAMHCSDNQNLGYIQFLRPWSRLEEKVTEQMREDEMYPVAEMKGAVFDFPIRDSTQVALVTNDALRKAIPDEEKQYVSFTILRTLATPIGLIGRATAVYEADMKVKMASFPTVIPSALKLASQPNYRVDPERVIVSHLRKELPSWRDHLPEMFYSDIFSPEELGQPSVAFIKWEQQRKLHVTASRLYRKLWELDSVEEFQIVWLHCVQCHYMAFKEGKILHRDLSENNVMFWRKPPGQGSKTVKLKGVVNDWDMASRLNGSIFAPKSAAQHRTGTLPFMAIDLLTTTPSGHYYRHDLESFLYILLWAALRYRFKGKRVPLPSVICDKWAGPGIQDALGFKTTLDSNEESRKKILDAIPAEWNAVKSAWIEPLFELFAEARRSKPKVHSEQSAAPAPKEGSKIDENEVAYTDRDFFMLPGTSSTETPDHERDYKLAVPATREPEEQADYDYSTYGGRLTYKTFMEAIGQSGEDPTK